MKRYYIKLNNENYVQARYNSLINKDIPTEAMEVSEEVFNETIANNLNFYSTKTKKFEYKEIELPIETLKTNKLSEIKSAFDYQESNGTIFVDNDTFEIDARRTDKDNMDDLIKYSNFPIEYVGKTTTRLNTTKEELEKFRKAVFDYGVANYEKKWLLETQVANATTKEELELIKW